jgi:hypothetical protein
MNPIMFSEFKKYLACKKFFLLFGLLFFFQPNSDAQSMQSEKAPEKKNLTAAARESSGTILKIAKVYAEEQARLQKLQQKEEEREEGILSLIRKTVEEVDRKAERQYQNNRIVSIKEEDE